MGLRADLRSRAAELHGILSVRNRLDGKALGTEPLADPLDVRVSRTEARAELRGCEPPVIVRRMRILLRVE